MSTHVTLEKSDCEKLLEDETLTAKVEIPIPYNRLLDLLTSAFEGGSNYWIDFVHQKEGENWGNLPKGGFKYVQEVPFLGGTLLIEPNERVSHFKVPGTMTTLQRNDDVPYEEEVWALNLETIERGIKVMASLKKGEGGHHWPNFLKDEADAETGDVFLQCCLFGEIVFG